MILCIQNPFVASTVTTINTETGQVWHQSGNELPYLSERPLEYWLPIAKDCIDLTVFEMDEGL